MNQQNYQRTLNLPQTSFSMKAGLAEREPKQLEEWARGDLYAKIREKSKGGPFFVLHDGPPYANGNIHIGHVLNKVLKDFIVKMKAMQGFDSYYVPGWDCHGLPIEHQLFKELKKKKSEVEGLSFRKKAHDYAMKYVGIQREQFKRLGVFGQWEKPYLTLLPEYEYWILKSFGTLLKKGYIHRGLKPVNWCAECETALAEAEVEYEDHVSPSVYVRFKVNNPQVIGGLDAVKPVFLLIWTTTPWTLLANVAVAVHHAFEYVLVDTGAEILIIEKSLKDRVFEKGNFQNPTIVKELNGEGLKDLLYTHPFGIKENCRVITVDYVTKEEGTGLVHTAPGHGQEDYEAGLKYNLEMLMPVNDFGCFTAETGKFAGRHVFKANEEIIEDLKQRGLLFAAEKIGHSYPHCWRCKKPVIFRATHQWFMKIDHDGLREKLIEAVKEVEWIPLSGEERILGMITGRPDWCLSRQRHWGVPIPALKIKGGQDQTHRLYPEVIDHFIEIVRKEGSDAWFARDVEDLIPPGFKCPETGAAEFEKTFDILDVWFDSGVSHQAVLGPMMGLKPPADLYLEGSDQHRGWFQSSIIPSVAIDGKAPYKAVLTHGFVVDGQGRKMSKSLGNVISPHDVIKQSGAEILRLWVAASSYNDDIRLSDEIKARVVDAYRKIRNTIRFLLGNIFDFDPDHNLLAYKEMLSIDRWALCRLADVCSGLKTEYNHYEFADVYKMIYAFCNEDLSGFYLDILKDRLYTSHALAPERRSAQTVLYHILNHLVRYLAPVIPFTAEEIFQAMPKGKAQNGVESVHFLNWLDIPNEWFDPEIREEFDLLARLRPYVLKAIEEKRRQGMIGGSLEAKMIFSSAGERDWNYLSRHRENLRFYFIVSQVELQKVEQVEAGLGEEFSKTQVVIEKADGSKCSRCWNYSIEVGKDREHETLCERCWPVVKQIEKRS